MCCQSLCGGLKARERTKDETQETPGNGGDRRLTHVVTTAHPISRTFREDGGHHNTLPQHILKSVAHLLLNQHIFFSKNKCSDPLTKQLT